MGQSWILGQTGAEEAPQAVESTPVGEDTRYESVTKSNGSPDVNAPADRKGPLGGLLQSPLIFLLLMLVLFYFLIFRGPRKQQQQHRKMIQSLRKNDRVRTIGGIIGTVVDIKEDEITLKIDESTNTKMKVSPSAIGRILSKDNKK